MSYQIKGTLVCDLCLETIREDTIKYVSPPFQQPDNIVNFQLGTLKGTLCFDCMGDFNRIWNVQIIKMRKDGRLANS